MGGTALIAAVMYVCRGEGRREWDGGVCVGVTVWVCVFVCWWM